MALGWQTFDTKTLLRKRPWSQQLIKEQVNIVDRKMARESGTKRDNALAFSGNVPIILHQSGAAGQLDMVRPA
jgi:hypothetical protein